MSAGVSNSAARQRPVVAGLFEETAAGTQLLAAYCPGCGTTYFPRSTTCRNPDCNASAPEPVALSQRGVLYSYTVQHYRPPPLFRMDDWSPYAIGLVEFPEGVRVMGMLFGVEPDAVRIGETYVLGSRVLYHDEEGIEVCTHVFERDAGGTA